PAKGTVAVTAIGDYDIVADLQAGAKGVKHLDIGVLAGCVGILLIVPRLPDFFEIIEALVGPVDIAAPTEMDQPAIEPVADPVFLATALTERDLVDRARAIEPLGRRVAGVEPCSLADDLEHAGMALETKRSEERRVGKERED